MTNPPRDPDDPLDPLLAAAFAAREGRVQARGEIVAARLRLEQGIEPTPLVLGPARPTAGPEIVDRASITMDSSRYELLEEIGRGGLGLVLRGRDVNLRRDVAVKVLRTGLADRKDLVERFLLEAQLGGQLQHPGVAPVYDLGITEDGRPFFTMKLVQGSTLAELLDERDDERGGTVHLLGIFSQICKAVGYAHARGVVHRDLKPVNVMVGEFGEVQVVDWGLAKVAGLADGPGQGDPAPVPDLSASPDSRLGNVVGTPGFMAPEQARGETACAASDVYSLGVMLFDILAGRALGKLGSPESVDVGRVRELLSGHDTALQRLVLECLEPNPANRPPDALAVARCIDTHMVNSEERVRRAELATVEATTRALGERKAHRLTLALVASVIAAGALGIVGWQWLEDASVALEIDAERRDTEAADRSALEQLRAARLELLRTAETEQVFYADAVAEFDAADRTWLLRKILPGLDHLEESYEIAHRTAASQGIRAEIGGELNIVRAARRMLADESSIDEYALLPSARERGLLAFLVSDPVRCVREWESLDLRVPEPLAEAALGHLHLFRDEPALARGLLMDAYRAYPESVILCVDLADAEARLGRVEQTQRLLAEARALDEELESETDIRIEADLAALGGDMELALERYRYMLTYHRSPQANLHCAAYLASSGAYLAAAQPLWLLVDYHPAVQGYARDLTAMLELGWRSCEGASAGERLSRLLDMWPKGMGPPSLALGWFRDRVRDGYSPEPAVTDAWKGTAGSFERLLRRRSRSPDVSPSGSDLELAVVLERLDEATLAALDGLLARPRWLRELHCRAYLDGGALGPGRVALIERLWTTLLRVRQAPVSGRGFASSARPASPVASGSAWISRHNGPGNARRARGEHLFSEWVEAWRRPRHGHGVLVEEGLVVFQDDPKAPDRFVGLELVSGEQRWTHTTGPNVRAHPPGCILDGRIFLPLGRQGWSAAELTQRVECLDLATGELLWTWDSGLVGGVRGLQPFERDEHEGNDVVFCTLRYHGRGLPDLRFVALDASAGRVAAETPVTERARVHGGPALWQDPGTGSWSTLWHMLHGEGDAPYRSTGLVAHGFESLGAPGGVTLALSSQILPDSKPLSGLGSPLVIDGAEGFLYETGGYLRAYDLAPLTERWAVGVTTSYRVLHPFVVGDVVVLVDPSDVEARAYDRSSGSLRWTTPLPAPTRADAGVVLDGGTLLLPLLDPETGRGSVFALSAKGRLEGPLLAARGLREVYAVDGHVLVGTDSELLCFRPAGPGPAPHAGDEER